MESFIKGHGASKDASHLMFAFASAFREHLKFLSTSRKCKCYVRTLPLVVIEPIHENVRVDVTC